MRIEKAGLGQPLGVLDGRKSYVNRRSLRLFAQLAQRPDQRVARALGRVGRDEQPAPGHWREGHGHLKLGIIVAAGALVSVGPGVIEHVFALAVALEIAGRGGDQASAPVFDRHMRGRPARAAANRARNLERIQEGVGDERVEPLALRLFKRATGRIGAGVPRRGVDAGDGRDDACGKRGGHGRAGGPIWRHRAS